MAWCNRRQAPVWAGSAHLRLDAAERETTTGFPTSPSRWARLGVKSSPGDGDGEGLASTTQLQRAPMGYASPITAMVEGVAAVQNWDYPSACETDPGTVADTALSSSRVPGVPDVVDMSVRLGISHWPTPFVTRTRAAPPTVDREARRPEAGSSRRGESTSVLELSTVLPPGECRDVLPTSPSRRSPIRRAPRATHRAPCGSGARAANTLMNAGSDDKRRHGGGRGGAGRLEPPRPARPDDAEHTSASSRLGAMPGR